MYVKQLHMFIRHNGNMDTKISFIYFGDHNTIYLMHNDIGIFILLFVLI